MNCKKFYYSKASYVGVQGNILQWPALNDDGKYVFDFPRPFLLFGYASVQNAGPGEGYLIAPQTAAFNFANFDLIMQLYVAFMEANRDGISSNGFVTYEGDYEKYFYSYLNESLLPMNYFSFLMVGGQIQSYWQQDAAVPPQNAVQSLYQMFNNMFKGTNLKLWLAPGRYTVDPNNVFTNAYTFGTAFAQVGAADGSPNSKVQTIITKPADPYPAFDNTWKFSLSLRKGDGTLLYAIDNGLDPAYLTLTGPDWAAHPAHPLAAIDAWLADGTFAGNLFRQLGTPALSFIDSSFFAMPWDATTGAAYNTSAGSDGQTIDPNNAIYFRVGGAPGGPGFDWGTLATANGENVHIGALIFYQGGLNPISQDITDLIAAYMGDPLAFLLEEQQSIE